MSMPQIFPFQLKLDVKECHFRLDIVVSSNPINFINAHSLHLTSTRITMRNDKDEWITAYNCGKPKMEFHSRLVLAEKGTFEAWTLPHKMCPRKQTTEPKLVILVYFFSGEVTSYTDTNYCILIMLKVCRSVFYGPPCILRAILAKILRIKMINLWIKMRHSTPYQEH